MTTEEMKAEDKGVALHIRKRWNDVKAGRIKQYTKPHDEWLAVSRAFVAKHDPEGGPLD